MECSVLILPGLRRLMPVPYVYLMPDFSWLDKKKYDRFKIPLPAPVKNAVLLTTAPVSNKRAVPLNQPNLFA